MCAPVAACALSADGRCLWAAAGNGFILRYEYRRPQPEQVKVGLWMLRRRLLTAFFLAGDRLQARGVCLKHGMLDGF